MFFFMAVVAELYGQNSRSSYPHNTLIKKKEKKKIIKKIYILYQIYILYFLFI